MIIEQINLTNYRCFERLELPLDPHLNVFVGGNGSGKSTILHALAIGLAPILAALPFEKGRKPKTPVILPSDVHLIDADRSATSAAITVQSRVNGGPSLKWTQVKSRGPGKGTGQVEKTNLKPVAQYAERLTAAQNADEPYSLPVFAFYGTNRAVTVPVYRLRDQVLPTFFRRLAGLDDALDSSTDFRRSIGWFDFLERRELRLLRDKEISGKLPEFDCVRRAISGMVDGIDNPRIDGTTGRFAVDYSPPGKSRIKLYIDQLSDGYQVLLGVVMDFALRLALANPSEQTHGDALETEAVLMIDEVDLHLHPGWQQHVIPNFRKTFPNTQLILTTHSPQVTTTVPSTNLRVLANAKLHSATPGTEGAEAQRLLEDVFGVPARPDVKRVHQLDEYLRLVDAREFDSPKARELRAILDGWSQGAEPRLFEADLQIENLRWEMNL